MLYSCIQSASLPAGLEDLRSVVSTCCQTSLTALLLSCVLCPCRLHPAYIRASVPTFSHVSYRGALRRGIQRPPYSLMYRARIELAALNEQAALLHNICHASDFVYTRFLENAERQNRV